MAPEVLDALFYDNSSDLWSLGVIFYNMIYKKFPYNEDLNFKSIEFPPVNNINSVFIDITKSLLDLDPIKRMPAGLVAYKLSQI